MEVFLLKLSLTLIIFNFSLAHARVEFEELIKNDINKQNELAIETQQFAKIETYTKDGNKPYYIKKEAGKEKDFKVSLKRITKKKDPINQRSIASKDNRVSKKTKTKTKTKKQRKKD